MFFPILVQILIFMHITTHHNTKRNLRQLKDLAITEALFKYETKPIIGNLYQVNSLCKQNTNTTMIIGYNCYI